MVNWKKFKKQIPISVQMGKSVAEVLWTEDFKDGNTLGEMRHDPKQIVIKKGQSPKNTVVTYIHETAHFVDSVFEIGLTESQIRKMEKAFYYLLKPGNVFKE